MFSEDARGRSWPSAPARPRTTCRDLAGEVGRLPLALAQAAAVIVSQHLDYRTCLERLRAFPGDEYLVRAEGDRFARGLAAAVLLSLDAVAAGGTVGLPGTVMSCSVVLSSAGVAGALLLAPRRRASRRAKRRGATVAPEEVDQALGRLAGSLLAFTVTGPESPPTGWSCGWSVNGWPAGAAGGHRPQPRRAPRGDRGDPGATSEHAAAEASSGR